MLKEMMRGAAAGALGTAILNTTTYADMALRGRPASETPKEVVERLAERTHMPLHRSGEDHEKGDNRADGLAALTAYVAGVVVGAGYGALRARLDRDDPPGTRRKRVLRAGPAIATAAMAVGDTPTVATGASDPRDWNAEAWTVHAVPHLLFGLGTAAAYEAMRDGA